MRNAVIRKKRIQVERMVEDYMRFPQGIITPSMDITIDEVHDWNVLTPLPAVEDMQVNFYRHWLV